MIERYLDEYEKTRLLGKTMDERRQAVLVRDMKNPGQKIGNDVWCHLPRRDLGDPAEHTAQLS